MTTVSVEPSTHDDRPDDHRDDRPNRWILASFSAAAGIVHVVMAPSHFGASTLEGGGFLVAAWLQLALAVALVARPSRRVLQAVVVLNALLVLVWAVSRTAGLPFGGHADHPETVSFVDGSCVAFELLLVALAGVWLWRPEQLRFKGGAFAVGVPLAVFAVASAAIAQPEARDHSAHSHGGHTETAGGSVDGQGGHVHGAEGESAAADDKGLSLLTDGHQHSPGAVELDDATQAELTAQLVETAELVRRYPTVAAAEAQGLRRQGPFTPGQGTYFTMQDDQADADGVLDEADLLTPIVIFDGSEPDAPIAGFMYQVLGDEEPEGFAGPNDHWHRHTEVCMVTYADGPADVPFGADDSSTAPELCAEVGGEMLELTGWMVHVWTVPGYESDRGVFSEINSKLTCPDGTYYQIPWSEVGTQDSFCKNP